jgi:hypothetical protein
MKKEKQMLMTLQDFMDLGGVPRPGMKLFTVPKLDVENHIKGEFFGEHSKQYTFEDFVEGEGVKVKEHEKLLGTGWLYTMQDVSLGDGPLLGRPNFWKTHMDLKSKPSAYELERYMLPHEMNYLLPEEQREEYLEAQGIPIGFGWHPFTGYFLVVGGQGPAIVWSEQKYENESTYGGQQ